MYLHSNSTQILAYTKKTKTWKKKIPKKKKKKIPSFYETFQCGRYDIFKKNLKIFFEPEKVKKWASKVAHNRPRPFYFTVQPRPTAHSPELVFHIMKSRDQHLFSYLCFTYSHDRNESISQNKNFEKTFPNVQWLSCIDTGHKWCILYVYPNS